MTPLIEYPQQPPGFCLVLSAPSGAGKTTIGRQLLAMDPTMVRSVSMTTRSRRENEVEGRDYCFTTDDQFRRLIHQGAFLEWAEVHGDLYGTPRAPVENIIRDGRVALLVIDVQGGQSVKTIFPDAVLVFLMPPSLESLERRLRRRGTEEETVIRRRLAQAEHEMQYLSQYTYGVVNEDGQQHGALASIQAIIVAERRRISRWENS